MFCLNKVARKLGMVDAYSFNWEALRFEHTTLIAAWMQKSNASNYAYKVMDRFADDYFNAVEGFLVKITATPRPAAGLILSPEYIQVFLKTCHRWSRTRAIWDSAISMLMIGYGLWVGWPGKLKNQGFKLTSCK